MTQMLRGNTLRRLDSLLVEVRQTESIGATTYLGRVTGTDGATARGWSTAVVNGVATEALVSILSTRINVAIGLAGCLALLVCETSNVERGSQGAGEGCIRVAALALPHRERNKHVDSIRATAIFSAVGGAGNGATGRAGLGIVHDCVTTKALSSVFHAGKREASTSTGRLASLNSIAIDQDRGIQRTSGGAIGIAAQMSPGESRRDATGPVVGLTASSAVRSIAATVAKLTAARSEATARA